MLYDYFTKSAASPAEFAILGAPVGAAMGALSSGLTGGEWKDNLANAAGAGIGTGAGILGGGYGIIGPALDSEYSESRRSELARSIVNDRSKIKKLLDQSKTNPHITEEYINLERNSLADRVKYIRENAPGKVFNSKKLREIARTVAKHPWLSLGLFTGLGGGLGYTASNALTGREERPVRDVLVDYLKK